MPALLLVDPKVAHSRAATAEGPSPQAPKRPNAAAMEELREAFLAAPEDPSARSIAGLTFLGHESWGQGRWSLHYTHDGEVKHSAYKANESSVRITWQQRGARVLAHFEGSNEGLWLLTFEDRRLTGECRNDSGVTWTADYTLEG